MQGQKKKKTSEAEGQRQHVDNYLPTNTYLQKNDQQQQPPAITDRRRDQCQAAMYVYRYLDPLTKGELTEPGKQNHQGCLAIQLGLRLVVSLTVVQQQVGT